MDLLGDTAAILNSIVSNSYDGMLRGQLHSICFHHNIKDNERNLCQDLLTIEDSDLKVHAPHYANELLVRVRVSFHTLTRAQRGSFYI